MPSKSADANARSPEIVLFMTAAILRLLWPKACQTIAHFDELAWPKCSILVLDIVILGRRAPSF
jgi:hypothetical protein